MGSKESDTYKRLSTHAHVFNSSEADFMEGCKQTYYCKGLDCLYPYWKQEKVRKNYFLSSYV